VLDRLVPFSELLDPSEVPHTPVHFDCSPRDFADILEMTDMD
jgi:hypothetical protein